MVSHKFSRIFVHLSKSRHLDQFPLVEYSVLYGDSNELNNDDDVDDFNE